MRSASPFSWVLVTCLACGAAVTGCSDQSSVGFGVAMTLVFDQSFDDPTLAEVSSLLIAASGGEDETSTVSPGRPFKRNEREVFRPMSTTRNLGLLIGALDAQGNVLGVGSTGVFAIAPGQTVDKMITLTRLSLDMGVDFGTADASAPDGADHQDGGVEPDAGVAPSRCGLLGASDGLIFCHGYEAASEITYPNTTAGTVTVDSAHVYRGASALHLTLDGGSTGMNQVAQATQPVPQPLPAQYNIRAFVFLEGAPPTTPLLSFQQQTTPYNFLMLGVNADTTLYVSDTLQGQVIRQNSTTMVPLDTWVCLEFHVVRDMTASGTMNVFLGDISVTDLSISAVTDTTPVADDVRLGMYTGAPAAAYNVWLDEVVVASQHVGCEK